MTLGTPNVPSDTGYDARTLDSIRCGAGPFNSCTKVSIAPNGDLYVSDGYGNARVHRFSPKGELLQSWGEPGTGPGQFHLVHGVLVLPDGRVLVADRENDRIQFFSPDGEYLEQWTDVRRCAIIPTRLVFIYVAEVGGRPDRVVHQRRAPTAIRPRQHLRRRRPARALRGSSFGTAPGDSSRPRLAVDSHGDPTSQVTWTLYGQMGVRLDTGRSEFRRTEGKRPKTPGGQRRVAQAGLR